MNNKVDEVHIRQYEVDDNPKDQTKSTDKVDRDGTDFQETPESKLNSSLVSSQGSSAPVDYSSPGRIIVIERIINSGKDRNEQLQKSVDVFVPQRDIGEEAVVVWDAGLVLAYYLERHQITLGLLKSEKRIHVVDVGAGTGVVGLVAASLGANVTLTDLPRYIPLLEEGISANCNLFHEKESINGSRFIRALPLNWGNISQVHDLCRRTNRDGISIGGPPDLILASDCIYFEASIAPLVCTLRELACCTKLTVLVLLSYEDRDYSPKKKKAKENFFALAERYFLIQEIPTKDCHPEYSSDDIKIVKMSLLPTEQKVQN